MFVTRAGFVGVCEYFCRTSADLFCFAVVYRFVSQLANQKEEKLDENLKPVSFGNERL